jgi:hypothetical protein
VMAGGFTPSYSKGWAIAQPLLHSPILYPTGSTTAQN